MGIQFHPEVAHTPEGKTIIQNFLYEICGCQRLWTAGNFVADTIESIRAQVGDGKVICAISYCLRRRDHTLLIVTLYNAPGGADTRRNRNKIGSQCVLYQFDFLA
ncbi:MAG: hypothetical protein IH963_11755 [Chloroflexi bacterium]|nr:hypothetical protein [Chloroflexota bacterium]